MTSVKYRLVVNHHHTLVYGLCDLFEAVVGCAFVVIINHVLLIREDGDYRHGIALRPLVREGFPGLDGYDVWFAVL
jgi:hypothetical protein